VAVAIVLSITGFLSGMVRRGTQHYVKRYDERVNPASLYAFTRIASYTVLFLGGMTALNVAGIPMSKLMLLLGGLGVGLGFGLQEIFNNFLSGLIVLFDRSLKVGDFVELASGLNGTVRDIRIRSTRITTNDNVDVLIPNSEFISGRVINWTLQDGTRRLRIPFGVAYGSPKEIVRKAALEAAASVPLTLSMEGERAPMVLLTGFGDSSLNFELVVWVVPEATRSPLPATAAYNWALETALIAAGIEFPWPQRDLRVRSWFGLEGEAARKALAADLVRPGNGKDGSP
jgi:small-conductance mechanosensitive channel